MVPSKTPFVHRLLRSFPLAALLIAACAAMLLVDAPQAHYRRAMAAVDEHRFETATYELLWLQSNPHFEAQASLVRGALLVAEGEFQKAPHVLAVASADPETQVRAGVVLGECLYKDDQFLEAGKVWTRAVELDPDNIDAHRWLAAAYFDLRAVPEALAHLRRVAELEPRDPRPHRLMGRLCDEYWRPELAIEGYQEALRRAPDAPDNAEVRFDLAKVYYRLNEYQAALDQLSHCAPSADILALTAGCQHGLGREDQAEASLDEALRLNPKLVRALAHKGQLLLERGDVQAAAETLELALQQAPKDRTVLRRLAIACKREGQTEKAERLRQTIDRLDKLDAQYEAASLKAIEDPRDARARYELGMIATELGAPGLAKTWLQAAVNLDPGDARARAALRAANRELESD